MDERTAAGQRETRDERLNREVEEMMQELRAVIPGVQVLLAFLITVVFSNRFEELDDLGRYVFFGTFLAGAMAFLLLLGPASYHRIRFRQGDKDRMLRVSNVEAIAGMAFVLVSVAGVSYLITEMVFDDGPAAVTAAAVVLVGAAVWWGVPLVNRRSGRPVADPAAAPSAAADQPAPRVGTSAGAPQP